MAPSPACEWFQARATVAVYSRATRDRNRRQIKRRTIALEIIGLATLVSWRRSQSQAIADLRGDFTLNTVCGHTGRVTEGSVSSPAWP
jgi:hypothetical protein